MFIFSSRTHAVIFRRNMGNIHSVTFFLKIGKQSVPFVLKIRKMFFVFNFLTKFRNRLISDHSKEIICILLLKKKLFINSENLFYFHIKTVYYRVQFYSNKPLTLDFNQFSL